MRTTIKDIAKEAGVSIATVSRVLNRNAYVTEEIKKKVLKAAKDLNYIPNTAAKRSSGALVSSSFTPIPLPKAILLTAAARPFPSSA